METWRTHRRFAFMIVFLGCLVFPEREGRIDIRLAGVVQAMTTMKNPTLVPMILSDIFRALTRCSQGASYFEGCNILLQIWLLEHLYRHPIVVDFSTQWSNYITDHEKRIDTCKLPEGIGAWKELLSALTANQITWNFHWFSSKEVICESASFSFLVLIGLNGVQPYAPLRVMRQLGRLQEIPPAQNMSRFMYDFSPKQPHNEKEILSIWYASKVSELNEMVEDRDRGEVVPEYLAWFHDPSSFRDVPEGSNRKRKDQRIIERLKEELEHANTTIAQQQSQIQSERDYHVALREMEGDLRQAEKKIVQLGEELECRINLARQVEKERNAEILQLQNELDATRKTMHYQQVESKQLREQSEEERVYWVRSRGHLEAQVKELIQHNGAIQHANVEAERRWMIERATLGNRLETAEGKEASLRNDLCNHRMWLNNCDISMKQARCQVLRLAKQAAYINDDHRHLDDKRIAEQARIIVPQLPKVFQNMYETLGGQWRPQEDN